MNQEKPVLFSQEHIRRAMADDRFVSAMPEFAAVRARMRAAEATKSIGCNTCRQRRVAGSMSSDFMSVVARLPNDALQRLKEYLGVGRLLFRMLDKASGRVVMKEV